MTKAAVFVCASALAAVLSGATARAVDQAGEEKTLTRAQVPRPVVEAVLKKYPRAKLEKFGQEQEEGKLIYEVELKSGAEIVSIDVAPEGKILAEETTIKPADLPAPVKAGLQASRYKGWRIAKAEKVIHDEKDDAPEYEVVVLSRKEKFEVVLDGAGKVTREERKSPKDKD
jgi:hypothetical protein